MYIFIFPWFLVFLTQILLDKLKKSLDFGKTFPVSALLFHFSLPGNSDGKKSACNSGDPSSIPGFGNSLGEGNGNPFQYSYLENSMDRGTWGTSVHRLEKSHTQLSD